MKHLRSPIVSSIVLHSGQWLNKPRAKAEKGREKLGGRRGGLLQSERDQERTWLEKEQCVWKMTKKSLRYCSLQKKREAKKILTGKARREKSTFQEQQGSRNGL